MWTVPFVGRMSYCYSKCLTMILAHKGESHPLPFLECLSTVPFGFIYMPAEKGGFAVNGYNPHEGVERTLNMLKYKSEFKCFDSGDEALSYLVSALKNEPILVGPVDMGFLVYDPFCKFKLGADHYLVVLEAMEDHVVVNDPEGYLHVLVPIKDFLDAWEAEAIMYKKGSYSMWIVKQKMVKPSLENMYRHSLHLGLQNLKEKRRVYLKGKHVAHVGTNAIRKLAEDIRRNRSHRWLRFYATFTFRVSGQRCFDSSVFIKQAPFQNESLSKASEIRMKQAGLYGGAQLYAATKKFGKVSKTLLDISDLEHEFEGELEKGLQQESY